jgi:hypothetical protein
MNWTKSTHNTLNRKKIRGLCKTSYDLWIIPPSLDQLIIVKKSEPKSFANIRDDEIGPIIFNQLKHNEQLSITSGQRIFNYFKSVSN